MSASPFRAMLWADEMPPIRNEKGHVDLLAHRVLAHLARRADNDTLQAWPSVQKMALDFGFERREIRRALTVLEKLALIVDYGEADSGATIWCLAVDEPGPRVHLLQLEKQRIETVARANADRQAKFRARRNSGGGVTRNSEESVTGPDEPLTSDSNDEGCVSNSEGAVTPEPASDPSNGEGGVMSQRGARYVTARAALRNAASAPRTTKGDLPSVELPPSNLPTPTPPGSIEEEPVLAAPRGDLRAFLRQQKQAPASEEKPAAKVRAQRQSTPTDDPDFDRAWELYAYKVQRAAARKAWTNARKIVDAETIIAAIPAYVASTKLPKDPEQRGVYNRAHFASWLNGERWNDEIEPPKKGYQGRAGADAHPNEYYVDKTKVMSVPRLMRLGPTAGDRDQCYAWYYHWNHAEQADWTLEQLVEFGNTPEDAQVLHDAFRTGPHDGWGAVLADFNIKVDYR